MRLIHRPADRVIMAEVKKTYSTIPVRRGDVLLDLGAHIGAASRFLMDKGVRKVIAVEPDPANMRLLRRNLAGQTVIWAAVGSRAGRTVFHSAGSHVSSVLAGAGRTAIEVPMLPLGGLLERFHPSIVKCDIEFGEYDLPELRDLPPYVRTLAIEIHVRLDLVYRGAVEGTERMRDRRAAAALLIEAIRAQGFTEKARREKRSKDTPIEDETGLNPYLRGIDAVYVR